MTPTERVICKRPIIFSGAMVRAILAGKKTQTRRVITPQPRPERWQSIKPGWYTPTVIVKGEQSPGPERFGFASEEEGWPCPYGAPGDHLYVRETWQTVNSECGPGIAYKADSHFMQPEFDGEDFGAGPSYNYEKYPGDYCMWYTDLCGGAPASEGYHWRPSIHMPRWASRITLEILDVRVERVQDISQAEGMGIFPHSMSATKRFRELWDKINSKRGFPWASNPWVWVIEFRRLAQ